MKLYRILGFAAVKIVFVSFPKVSGSQRSATFFQNVSALHVIAYVMSSERYLLEAKTFLHCAKHLCIALNVT